MILRAVMTRELPLQRAMACFQNGLLLVPSHRSYVAVHHLITLEEKFRIHPIQSFDSVDKAEVLHRWSAWSPDSKLLAVLWGQHGQGTRNQLRDVTFHDSTIGQVVGHGSVPALQLSPHHAKRMTVTWSPASSHILLHSWDISGEDGNSTASIALFDTQGSARVVLQQPGLSGNVPRARPSAAQWSACGHYLHIVFERARGVEDVSEANAVHGFMWDVSARQKVFHWHARRQISLDSLQKAVVWARSATACYIRSCGIILSWISGGSSAPGISIVWPRQLGDEVTLLPCGRLHVNCWSLPSGGSYSLPSWDAAGVISSDLPRFHQLWHSAVRPGHGTCSMQSVESSPSRFHLKAIAWHPNPAARFLYAIINTCADLHLVSGLLNRVLRFWTWSQISPEGIKPPKNEDAVYLAWSPDGAKLIVAAWSATTVLCFDSCSSSAGNGGPQLLKPRY